MLSKAYHSFHLCKEVFRLIVDFHTHTFPDRIAAGTIEKLQSKSHTRPFTDGTRDGLLSAMDGAGIGLSVTLPVATNTHQVTKVNDGAAALNGQGRVLSFGCMHPDFEDWEQELERIAALGLKGIKIHPVYQGTDIDDARYLRILDKCGQLGLVVVTHAGIDLGFPDKHNCTPAMIRRAVERVGPVKLVAAHMGGWRNWDEATELLADTNVYIDTSFSLGRLTDLGDGYYTDEQLELLDPEAFCAMVRAFGAHRVLFGTDSPWGGQAEDLAHFNALPLTKTEKRNILGENAVALLGLL